MGDVDRRRVDAVVQLAKLAHHQVAELGVERAERLVHQEGHRPAHDGAAERDALAVAAGKAARRAGRGDGRCAGTAPSPRRAADLGARHALALQREADVLADIHVRVEREELEDEGDVARRGAVEGDVVAAEQDAAGGRQFEAGDHAQRRRLAAARRPEHDEELAVGDGEVRVPHGDEIAEGLVEILDPDLGHRLNPEDG